MDGIYFFLADIFSANCLCYHLAFSFGIMSPTALRLNNTGQIKLAEKKYRIPMIILGILYILTSLAGLFYFSWAYLGLRHIAVFFFVYFTLGNNLAKKDDKNIVWGSFIWFTLISFVSEILLIYIYHPK